MAKQFSVDSVGAYVTRLDDASGQPVLFPRVMVGEKLRGGSHICYPYFGPDAAGVLAQHGFGRTVDWTVVAEDEHEVICTYSREEADQFAGLAAELRYRQENNTFQMHLTVTNQGDELHAVMPGFHPYFAVDPDAIRLNGQSIHLDDFEPFKEFPGNETMRLETADRLVTITSPQLTHMVVWSDAREDYLCIEPTLAGNRCDSKDLSSHLLPPGETVAYDVTITWSSSQR